MTVAPEKGAILAGKKGPALWLRYGQPRAQRRGMWLATFSGGMNFRSLRLFGVERLAFELQDDRSVD